MNFDLNENKPVIALLGGGAMACAIARRIGGGKTILIGSRSAEKLEAQASALRMDGYSVRTRQVDALDTESVKEFAAYAANLGPVKYFIDTAGASPNQSAPEHIVALDLVATAVAIDVFAGVIEPGGAGLVVSSQAGYMLRFSEEVERQLTETPTEKLADLEFCKTDAVANSGIAYMAAKRANHLRVRAAAATTWAAKRARINSISPGIIVTPLAYDEFNANGEGYQKMIEASPARRVGTPEEIAAAGAYLLGDEAGFITGTDLLIDGGVIAAMSAGTYALGV